MLRSPLPVAAIATMAIIFAVSIAPALWRVVRCAAAGVGPRSVTVRISTVPTNSTAAGRFTIGGASNSAVESAATVIHKSVASPPVAITPARPWAHAHEDTVVKVSGPVVPHRSTGVRWISVVTVGTGGLNADIDGNLCMGCWHHGQTLQQRYC
jgi:hypothetical protein